MSFKKTAALTATLIALAGAAQASTFSFIYNATFGQATGTFDGDVAADGDTITNITNFVVELSTQPGAINSSGLMAGFDQWSLSGLTANLMTVSPFPAGFAIQGGVVSFGDLPPQMESYDAANAAIELVPVPLPGSAPVLGLGLGLLALVGFRRKATD